MAYITKIRLEMNLLCTPRNIPILKLHLNAWFLGEVNHALSCLDLQDVPYLVSFKKAAYICESSACSTIAQFKFKNAGLGNRAPRPGRQRSSSCSLCQGFLDEAHIAFLCPNMEDYRSNNTDLTLFAAKCAANGFLPRLAYKLYITGMDCDRKPVSVSDYLKRGQVLGSLLKEWLRRS